MFFTCSVHLLPVTHNGTEHPYLVHSGTDNMKALWAGFLQQAGIIFMPRDTISGTLCIVYAHITCQVGRRTKLKFVKGLSFHLEGVIYAELPLLIFGW